MFKEIWGHIQTKKGVYVAIVLAIISDYTLAIVPAKIIQHIINAVSENKLSESDLWLQLTILFTTAILAYASSVFWTFHIYKESNLFQYLMRKRLFNKLLVMRTPYYEKFRSGDMITRFTSDIENLSVFLGYGFMSALIVVATLVVILPNMLLIDWRITLLTCIPLSIATVIFHFITVKQEQLIDQSRDAVSQLSNEVLEVVEGIRVTRAYSKTDAGFQKFKTKTAQLSKIENQLSFYSSLFARVGSIAIALSIVLGISMGGLAMQEGTMQLGEVVAIQIYLYWLLDPMWMVSDWLVIFQSGKLSHSKLNELLQETDGLQANGTLPIQQINRLQMKNYSFTYPSATEASLMGIEFEMERGQTLGIVGKTGSGKTTLVRQLLMQYAIGNGTFTLNDTPIIKYDRTAIEKLIGYVPQEHTLFSRSVKENVEIGKPNADILELAAAIESAAFTKDLENMENGMDTLIGEKGVAISGGQKQRISIARAFIKDPELLILDDSLSAVDAKTEQQIIKNIQTMRQDKTTIIVTHRLSAVNHADLILVLDNGKIVESGTVDQLLANKGWYFEQHERQQLESEGEDDI